MPVRRALVDCVVLSLQDKCVYYPSCKSCLSKIEVPQTDTTARCRCARCGCTCLKEQVEYRYRLSLRVTRNSHVFGVTVFGSCLNAFFGTPATNLQRLVVDSEGLDAHNTATTTLLAKAVEDCFGGRRFIFGIKVSDADRVVSPLFSTHPLHPPLPSLAPSAETVHFIATHILLHCAAAPGYSVVSYYQRLLQQATLITDPSTALSTVQAQLPDHPSTSSASRPPPCPLLLQPTPPSASLLTSPTSCLRPPASQHPDHTLSSTPPWQLSLGVVTSSAEQDEGCSFQGNGGGGVLTGRQICRSQREVTSPRCHLPASVEGNSGGVSTSSSPLMTQSLRWGAREDYSVWNSLSVSVSPEAPIHDSFIHTPSTHTCSAPPKVKHSRNITSDPREGELSDGLEEYSQLGSIAWEDMPFSESLGEFVYKAESDRLPEREVSVIKSNVERKNISSQRSLSHSKNQSNETIHHWSVSKNQSNETVCHSENNILLVSSLLETGQTSGHGVGHSDDQTYRGIGPIQSACPNGEICLPEWEGGDVSIGKSNGEEKEEYPVSCDTAEEYNCSVDLFNCFDTSMNMQADWRDSHTQRRVDTHSHTQCRVDTQSHTHSPQDMKDDDESVLDQPDCSTSLDFIPFSQSTPMAKRTAKRPALIEISPFRTSNYTHTPKMHSNKYRLTPMAHNHRPTPPSPGNKHITPRIAPLTHKNRHPLSSQRNTHKTPKTQSSSRQYVVAPSPPQLKSLPLRGAVQKTIKRESVGVCDTSSVSVCESDSEIPPTCQSQHSVRQRLHAERTVRDGAHPPWKLQPAPLLRESENSEVIIGCGDDDELPVVYNDRSAREAVNFPLAIPSLCDVSGAEACDWSRDLFGDSF